MEKQALGALLFRKAAVAGEIAIGRVANNRKMAFVALHPQLMASTGDGLELQESMRSPLLEDFHMAF